MGRVTAEARQRNEAAVRAAMDRLLQGEIPPGGKCDLQTLAAAAGVTRTGFYPKSGRPGPYQHLAEEFERRRETLHRAGAIPDPRDAQITRLKDENARLRARIAELDATTEQLTTFKTLAISRLAAQHEEIEHLRRSQQHPRSGRAHPLPAPSPTPIIGPC